jgi:hypothetical protein
LIDCDRLAFFARDEDLHLVFFVGKKHNGFPRGRGHNHQPPSFFTMSKRTCTHGTYFPTDVWSNILEMAVDTVANQHKAHCHKVAEYEATNTGAKALREEFDFFATHCYSDWVGMHNATSFPLDSEWDLRSTLDYHHDYFLSEEPSEMDELLDHLDSYLS